MPNETFHPIPEILEEIREGRMVIVVDDGAASTVLPSAEPT